LVNLFLIMPKGISMHRLTQFLKPSVRILSILIIFFIPVLLHSASVSVSWNSNTEPDLAGYQVYYGTQSGNYGVVIDVGNVTEYTVSGLEVGKSYYFAVTAYDENWNESDYSDEVIYQVADTQKPMITSVSCLQSDRIRVVFNEPVEKLSAELITNYRINTGTQVIIQNAELGTDLITVTLTTTQHSNGTYMLTVNNVRDRATVPNTMDQSQINYTWQGTDQTPPAIVSAELKTRDFLLVTFSEPLNQTTALQTSNYNISPSIAINFLSIDQTFTKITINTAEHASGLEYTLTVNNVQDGAGNTITANSQKKYQWISEDTTPPDLIAARLNNITSLELEFSEPLDQTSAQNVQNYSISPSVNITQVSLDVTRTIVTLTTAAHSGGTYVVTVSNIGDDENPPNVISTPQHKEYVYTPPDQTPPTLVAAEVTSGNLLRVTFSEPLDDVSSTNINNYTISPSLSIESASLDVTRKIVLLVTTQSHVAGTYRLTVSNIKDRATTPNTIQANSFVDYSYNPPDITPPVLTKAVLHGANVLELFFSESLDRVSSETESNYLITPSVAIQNATLVGDSLNRVYLATGNHQQGVSYTIKVTNVFDKATVPNVIVSGTKGYDLPSMDTTPPALVNVKLQGDSFLELEFSEPLDQVSATNIGCYAITPAISITEASIDNSLKKVFLKTGTHVHGMQYTLTVNNVKDIATPANSIQQNTQRTYTCGETDNIPPRLIMADLHGTQMLELSFSEALDASSALDKSHYSISNGIAVYNVSISQSQMQVFLETSVHQQGSYTVTVTGVKDLSVTPNVIGSENKYVYTYTPVDTERPVLLSVELLNTTMLKLRFSEALNRISAEDTSNYSINNGVKVVRAILDVEMTNVILQTTVHQIGSFTLLVKNIQDGSQAKNVILPNTYIQYDYLPEDNSSPKIVSSILHTDQMLVVTFSEPLDSASAQEKSNYFINNNIQIHDIFLSSSEGQVVLETSPHAAGEYELTVNGIKDCSVNKNPIAAYTKQKYTWSPIDTISPALISAKLQTNQLLELTFSEPVGDTEARNKENYVIDPPVNILMATLDANFKTVWLTTAAHEAQTYTITVSNIKDRAFNPNTIKLSNNSYNYTYMPPDTVAPELVTAKLQTYMSLSIVFNEPVSRSSAENATNYTITPNIKVNNAYLRASLTEVLLETDAHQSGITYTISVAGITDRAPIPNILKQPIEKTYTYSPPDTTRPKLLSVKLQGANALELRFDEALEKTSAQDRKNYYIEPGVEVYEAVLDPSNTKNVYLSTSDHRPSVSYSINVQHIKDRAAVPNVISPDTWFVYTMQSSGSSADNTPPVLARVEILSPILVDLVFSEQLEKTSAENKNNYTINDSIVVNSAQLDSNGVRVHLSTSPHRREKAYQIHVSNISDRALHPNIMASGNGVNYLLSEWASVSGISQTGYQFSTFRSGEAGYVDRNYTIDQAPQEIQGAIQILTANNDKATKGENFLSFQLRGEATIYVAYDNSISQTPTWLQEWTVTGKQVIDSRSKAYHLFSEEITEGQIILGANYGTMDDDMYLVFIVPHKGSRAVLANLNKSAYQINYISVGDVYYIDRDYRLSSVPDTLKHLMWIQTANDDKVNRDTDFLQFYLNQTAVIYVAYDAQIASLPKWLIDWELMDEQIVDSRGKKFDVLYKQYEEGEVTLGGNCGSVDDNMYLVIIRPLGNGDGSEYEGLLPGKFDLGQNYPNPFNPETSIEFAVQKPGRVTLTVYNILGQRVRVLVDEYFPGAAQHTAVWDGKNECGNIVASGVYIYRVQQNQFAKTKRMLFLR